MGKFLFIARFKKNIRIIHRRLFLGWAWLLVVLGLIILGFLLWRYFSAAPGWMLRAAPIIPANRWGRLLGLYAFIIVVTHLIIYYSLLCVRLLFDLIPKKEMSAKNIWPPILVGFCESILYPTSFLVGKPEFIAIWLALKTAGQWKLWQEGHKDLYEGRRYFQMFLIGNALSVAFGLLAFGLIRAFVLDP